ncbi:MAG: A/G-specific adenine glycosylase [Spirochaetes bacterium]|nr:A/G-specific adenine glycosylase [Spirochaetota bacterium]
MREELILEIDMESFRREVCSFYRREGRTFPWRITQDPYEIVVSEFMLQQTRTETVEKKYLPFLTVFPTLETLANAPLSMVLLQWKGLGYNRRALYLKEFARYAWVHWKGTIPSEPNLLQQCKGIGPYTARAIVTFAYNLPHAFIETNIRRVFLHHFFPSKEGVHDREILPLIERTLDRDHPREWYYALMDYGAYLSRQFPNPNRRSRHFTRQAPFEGSRRQLRGRILSTLLSAEKALDANTISARISLSYSEAEALLKDLAVEGFVVKEGGKYRIRDH